MRTPLAWLSLVHDRRRFATAVTGVAFAVFLMFVEMGFLNGVYDSQTDIVNYLDADLFIVNRIKEDFLPTQPFPRRRLIQARADTAVDSVSALYVEEYAASWRSADDAGVTSMPVFGIDTRERVLKLPEVAAHAEALEFPYTAMVDSRSRDRFGDLRPGARAEVADRRLRIVGTFTLGPNFRSDGMLVMSDRNFLRYFADPVTGRADPERVEVGLVRLHEGAGLLPARARIERILPDDVGVLTADELKGRIEGFWKSFQPIGAVFGLGAVVGFVIGVTICYQILFNDVNDHLPQFATLKAMGYHDAALVRTVTSKSVLLACAGFVPGLLLAAGVYGILEQYTGIRMWMTPGRMAAVLSLAVSMCVCAALLAVRRALAADPAELF